MFAPRVSSVFQLLLPVAFWFVLSFVFLFCFFISWILFNLALFPAFVLLRLDSLDASFDNKAFVF